jgi:hypothetical protein
MSFAGVGRLAYLLDPDNNVFSSPLVSDDTNVMDAARAS